NCGKRLRRILLGRNTSLRSHGWAIDSSRLLTPLPTLRCEKLDVLVRRMDRVQVQIKLQNPHARLPQEAKLSSQSMFLNQTAKVRFGHSSFSSYASHLELSCRR